MKHFTLEEKNALLENPFAQIQRKTNTLLNVGKLLMENGSDTTYIIKQMLKTAAFMGIPEEYITIHISYNTLMIHIADNTHSYTAFRRTAKHEINMTMIDSVSKGTWRALERNYSLATLETVLKHMQKNPPHYPLALKGIGSAIGCGALSILFGGNFLSAIITAICALLGFITRFFCKKFEFNEYLSLIAASFIAMSSAYLLYQYIDNYYMVYAMICCTLFMIPGIPLINSVIDTINNHFVSGFTRLLHTITTVGSMTVGMAMALHFSPTPIFASIDVKPHLVTFEQIIAAFVAAVFFSILFNTPYRLLPYIGIGGIICVGIRNLLLVNYHFALPGASFVGAAIVSIIMVQLASWLKTSSTTMTIPSIIPLIPGVLLYRFLFDSLHIASLDTTGLLNATQNGVTGLLTIIGIAFGVAVPNVIAQKAADRARLKRIQELLAQRHPD